MIHKLKLLLLTVIMVCFVDIVFSQNNDVIWIIEPQFDEAWDFHEGMARVKIDGKWGYINKEGTVIIEPQFDRAFDFHEGMAPVNIDGKWGYINKEGTVIIKPQFDDAYYFQESLARVYKDGKYGYIKNPLSAKEIVIHYEQAGAFVGTIDSIQGNEVIVAGKIAEKVQLGDKICVFNEEKLIILQADFPMMTTSKCRVISGSIKDLQKGMKVYLYNKKSKENKDKE